MARHGDVGVQLLADVSVPLHERPDIGVQIVADVNVKLHLRWLLHQVKWAGAARQAIHADGDDVSVWELAGLITASFRSRSELCVVETTGFFTSGTWLEEHFHALRNVQRRQ